VSKCVNRTEALTFLKYIFYNRRSKLRQYGVIQNYDCTASTVFLPVRPHCVTANSRRYRYQEDLKSFPLGELEETIGMPSYYMNEDYPVGDLKFNNLSLNEAIDVAQNRPGGR